MARRDVPEKNNKNVGCSKSNSAPIEYAFKELKIDSAYVTTYKWYRWYVLDLIQSDVPLQLIPMVSMGTPVDIGSELWSSTCPNGSKCSCICSHQKKVWPNSLLYPKHWNMWGHVTWTMMKLRLISRDYARTGFGSVHLISRSFNGSRINRFGPDRITRLVPRSHPPTCLIGSNAQSASIL